MINWRVVRTALPFLLLATMFGAARAHADQLKLGNEGTYPPFSMVDSDGTLRGVEPDLAREMCKRMHASCEFVVMDFKALIPSLLQGKVDALVSQTNPLPERKTKALFTIPIVYNPDSFVVPMNSHYRFTNEGLQHVRLGLLRGSDDLFFIQRAFGRSVSIVLYDNADQIRLDLLAGRIDGTFGHKIIWTQELIGTPEGKNWKFDGGDYWVGDPGLPKSERGYSWVARKGPAGENLIMRMNVALQTMVKDCSFTKIRQRYLQVPILEAEGRCIHGPDPMPSYSLLSAGRLGYLSRLADGALITMGLAVMGYALSLVCGILVALLTLSGGKSIQLIWRGYASVIMGVPSLLVIFLIYYSGSTLLKGVVDVSPFAAGLTSIVLVYTVYVAELVSGAIRNLPRGQFEAGAALALRPLAAWRHIIMPQAIRLSLAGLLTIWMVILKDTTLVSLVGLSDIVAQAKTAAGATQEPFIYFFAASAFFIAFSALTLRVSRRLERRFGRGYAGMKA